MIQATGTVPQSIAERLENLEIETSGIRTEGSDVDLTFKKGGRKTTLYAVGVGNGRWVVEELDDSANLFPQLEEGDSIGGDFLSKLFASRVNSAAIFSFNPLGRVAYAVGDVGKAIKRGVGKVVDWATDQLYAEDAENWIRTHGPYERTFHDKRDGKTRSKKDFNGSQINLGKLESLGEQGHYKALSGNPATGDFQVWHLYKNGNKIRCLEVKTGLEAQEAQWVYDNNIPKTWTDADWNPSGEDVKDPSEITTDGQDVEQNEENNVDEAQETQESQESQESQETEDDGSQVDPDEGEDIETQWYSEGEGDDDDNVIETVAEKDEPEEVQGEEQEQAEEDNVDEDDGDKLAEMMHSSADRKKKKKEMNVTGCEDGNGGVVLASLIESDLTKFDSKSYGTFSEKSKEALKKLMVGLKALPPEVARDLTAANGSEIRVDFSKSDLTDEKYYVDFDFKDDSANDGWSAELNGGKEMKRKGEDALKTCLNTLQWMSEKIGRNKIEKSQS